MPVSELPSKASVDPESPGTGAAAQPSARVRASRLAAVSLLLALVALGLAWELWWAPTGRGTLALKVLPLALLLSGLLKFRLWSYRAASLLVWLYVAEGLVRGTTERLPSAALAWLQVALSLGLFAACLVQVRTRLRAQAEAVPAGVAPGTASPSA